MNVSVVAVDGLEILQELTTGVEKTSSLRRSPVAFLSDRQRKRCVNCEGTAACLGQQQGSAFLPVAHALPSPTYLSPVGKGIDLDSGRWSSSLGIEGNHTKGQISDPRSFWFNFLPFCNMDLLASVPLNEEFSVNYWVVNGTNQAEATNGFKDQLFGFTVKLDTNSNWSQNYYLGQEQPDRALHKLTSDRGAVRVVIRRAPNGPTRIFDSYRRPSDWCVVEVKKAGGGHH